MLNRRRVKSRLGLGVGLIAALLLSGASIGQEKRAESPQPDKPATARAPRGRLPAYFASVVSPKQREEVYKVQAEYEEQLAELRAQIEQLIAERDRAVDGVLSAEQLAEVTKMREEARKKREARSAARAKARADAQEQAPSPSANPG